MKLNRDLLRKLPLALRIEIEENAQRKPLTQSELAEEQRRILAALRKQKTPGQRTDLNGSTSEKAFSEVRATAIVGKLYGESHKQVEKRQAIVDAAEAEPERFSRLLADMDRTGRVNVPFKRLNVMRQAERIRAEPPPLPRKGPYRVGTIDIPYRDGLPLPRTASTAPSASSATQPSAAKARSLNASSRPASATPLAADSSPCYSLPTSIPQKPARASVAIARYSPPRSCSRAELRGSRIPIPTGSGRRKIIPGVSGDIRRFGRLR